MRSAYDLRLPSYDKALTEVGRGTPMGELLRRYWHPIGLIEDASQTPRKVRALGEDLILFRDGAGRPGLLHPRCAHRGSSLYYGRVEESGIRCCYHGWLFAADGACLDKPCEPDHGESTKARTPQPAYPLEERYGLIFAYLGPLDRKPMLPRYDVLEELDEGEWIEADDSSIGSGGPAIVPCNWLQHFENVMDPFHVPILHGSFSGNQFVANMAIMPRVEFAATPRGVKSTQMRDLGGGLVHRRITEAVHPTIRAVANPRAEKQGRCSLLGWVLPMDDASFRIYSAGRVREADALKSIRSLFAGRPWSDLSEEEHRAMPGDYEAQVSQGAITLHSEEHLAASDIGVRLVRSVLKKQLDALTRGDAPMGTSFDDAGAWVRLEAGTVVAPEGGNG